jgi:hypothetical protein
MTNQEITDRILLPVWRGIDGGFKSKYRSSIWQQFEANIRSAAYTSNLARFLEVLARKMGVVFLSTDVAALAESITTADGESVLHKLRTETTLLALLVRARNEERKAEYEKQKEEKPMELSSFEEQA